MCCLCCAVCWTSLFLRCVGLSDKRKVHHLLPQSHEWAARQLDSPPLEASVFDQMGCAGKRACARQKLCNADQCETCTPCTPSALSPATPSHCLSTPYSLMALLATGYWLLMTEHALLTCTTYCVPLNTCCLVRNGQILTRRYAPSQLAARYLLLTTCYSPLQLIARCSLLVVGVREGGRG